MDITPYKAMVHSLARRAYLKNRTFEYDELYHYGIIGLLDAERRFDPNCGAIFTTYAYYRIHGAIIDGIRSMGYLKRGPRNGEKTPVHVTLPQSLPSPEEATSLDRTIAQDLLNKTRDAVNQLRPRDRNLINYHYYQELDLVRTGEKLNLEHSWTSRLHQRTLKKLTAQLRSAE